MLSPIFAAVVLAAINLTAPSVVKAGTQIDTQLQTAVDSRTAQQGDVFTLRVTDSREPALNGATIKGHFTRVVQGGEMRGTEIHFLFDTITFASGASEQIRAFVVAPNVVRHVVTTPAPVSAVPTGRPGIPNSTVWETQIGPKTSDSSPTGGVAYASSGPIEAKPGTPVRIELASDLKVP